MRLRSACWQFVLRHAGQTTTGNECVERVRVDAALFIGKFEDRKLRQGLKISRFVSQVLRSTGHQEALIHGGLMECSCPLTRNSETSNRPK